MNREEIMSKLNDIFADLFEDEALTITAETSAEDIDEWDSLMHIALIAQIESEFDMKFDMKEALTLANIGDMVDAIEKAQ